MGEKTRNKSSCLFKDMLHCCSISEETASNGKHVLSGAILNGKKLYCVLNGC